MITDERIASFINSFNNDYDDAITAIRKEAEEQGVPIIRREAGEFIRLLLRMKKPGKYTGDRNCGRLFCYFYEQVYCRGWTYHNN